MVLLRSLILGVTFLFSKEILYLFFNDCIKKYYNCLQIKTKSLFFVYQRFTIEIKCLQFK